jgi:hypothetical protein
VLARKSAGLTSAVTDSEARKIVGTGERDGRTSKLPETQAQDAIRAELIGSDTCVAGNVTGYGNAPVLSLCRRLVDAGHNPKLPLHAYRGEMLCVVVRSIGAGSGLVVNEDEPRFMRWKPLLSRKVSRKNAASELAATPVAASAV